MTPPTAPSSALASAPTNAAALAAPPAPAHRRGYQHLPTHRHWSIQPPMIRAIADVIAIIMYSVWILVEHPEEKWRLVYRLGRLLTLNEDPLGAVAGSVASFMDWMPIAAQVLATIAAIMFAFELFRLLAGGAYDRLRTTIRSHLWPNRRRVILIGDGRAAHWMADDILAYHASIGRGVLLTHLRTERSASTLVHPLGALMVLQVHAITQRCLRQADIAHADDVVIVGDGDSRNLEALVRCSEALHATPSRRTTVHVRIDSPECAEQLNHAVENSDRWRHYCLDVRVFCPDEMAARQALAVWSGNVPAAPQQIEEVLMIGLGESAAAFLAMLAAATAPTPAPAKPRRINLMDMHPERAWARVKANFPQACAQFDPHLIHESADSDALGSALHDMVARTTGNLLISVSVGDVDGNLSIALRLAGMVRALPPSSRRITIFVRQSLAVNLGSLLVRNANPLKTAPELRVWGGLEDSFPVDLLPWEGGAADGAAPFVHPTT